MWGWKIACTSHSIRGYLLQSTSFFKTPEGIFIYLVESHTILHCILMHWNHTYWTNFNKCTLRVLVKSLNSIMPCIFQKCRVHIYAPFNWHHDAKPNLSKADKESLSRNICAVRKYTFAFSFSKEYTFVFWSILTKGSYSYKSR